MKHLLKTSTNNKLKKLKSSNNKISFLNQSLKQSKWIQLFDCFNWRRPTVKLLQQRFKKRNLYRNVVSYLYLLVNHKNKDNNHTEYCTYLLWVTWWDLDWYIKLLLKNNFLTSTKSPKNFGVCLWTNGSTIFCLFKFFLIL